MGQCLLFCVTLIVTSDRVAAGPPSVAAWPGVFYPYLTDSVERAFGPVGDTGGWRVLAAVGKTGHELIILNQANVYINLA